MNSSSIIKTLIDQVIKTFCTRLYFQTMEYFKWLFIDWFASL